VEYQIEGVLLFGASISGRVQGDIKHSRKKSKDFKRQTPKEDLLLLLIFYKLLFDLVGVLERAFNVVSSPT